MKKSKTVIEPQTEGSDFKAVPPNQAMEVLNEMLREFAPITNCGCLRIGDALLSLKANLTERAYHDSLRELRLTPVAAWDYESISRNALLREEFKDSEQPAHPDDLAILARLPKKRSGSRLDKDASESSEFACKTISQVREEVITSEGSRFGWPRIDVRSGETWMVTLIPATMGTQGSFFVRVGLHRDGFNSTICPRTTDAKLGGNPAFPCSLCDKIAKDDLYDFGEQRDCELVPHWAVFCNVNEIIDSDGELHVYTHDPSEPFLLILNEKMFNSVISASLDGTEGCSFFSTIRLFLDDRLHLCCSPWGESYSPADGRKWLDRLHEPGELRVVSCGYNVFPFPIESK